jgi:aspartate/glutamate/glutamine transport system substrate-binding protein
LGPDRAAFSHFHYWANPYSPTAAPTPAISRWDLIQQRGTIIVGIKFDVRDFGYLNPDTNEVEGFDADIGRAIAKQIFGNEKKIQFVEAISRNRIPFLQDGTVDIIISTLTITEDRLKVVDFSDVYYVTGQSLLVPKGSAIRSINDLLCKKVGTVTGSTANTIIRTLAPQTDVLLFDTYSDAVAAMSAGQVDAVVGEENYSFQRAAPDKWEIVGGQFTAEPFGIAVRKGEPQLLQTINTVLRQMKSDGRWQALYEKWITTPAIEPPPANWREIHP